MVLLTKGVKRLLTRKAFPCHGVIMCGPLVPNRRQAICNHRDDVGLSWVPRCNRLKIAIVSVSWDYSLILAVGIVHLVACRPTRARSHSDATLSPATTDWPLGPRTDLSRAQHDLIWCRYAMRVAYRSTYRSTVRRKKNVLLEHGLWLCNRILGILDCALLHGNGQGMMTSWHRNT